MDVPIISVITTVKNGELYLAQMLHSVNNQSYKKFEHIIVDDGSTDRTLPVLTEFAETFPNYPLRVYSPGSIGRGKCLNFAISRAKAAWIAIIDADDLWHPDKLQIQMATVDSPMMNEKTAVLATESLSFFGDPTYEEDVIPEAILVGDTKIGDFLIRNPICHSSVLIRKHIAKYSEDRVSQFDLELWLRLISSGYQIKILASCLTFHRKHERQSFEAMLGSKMVINSYRLKAKYSLKYGCFGSLFKSTIEIVYSLYIPRRLKILINKIFK